MKCPLIFQFHKGAIETRQDSVLGVFDPCFNPRAHVERDMLNIKLKLTKLFQSTRPRGARRTLAYYAYAQMMFQSTRPRGARPLTLMGSPTTICFNPRAHVGRDILSAFK